MDNTDSLAIPGQIRQVGARNDRRSAGKQNRLRRVSKVGRAGMIGRAGRVGRVGRVRGRERER